MELRRVVVDVAGNYGLAPIAASTHPFAHWAEQKQTPKERYRNLEEQMAAAAKAEKGTPKALPTKADKQKAAAIRKDNCQRAREQLATLDSGLRIARVKANGEREVLDDDQRATEARRAREAIASECR